MLHLRCIWINYLVKFQFALALFPRGRVHFSIFSFIIIIITKSRTVSDNHRIKVKKGRLTEASNYRTDAFFLRHIKDTSRWYNRGAEKHSLRVRRKLVRDRSVQKTGRTRATSRVFILASVHNWRIPLSSLLPRITEPRCTRGATGESERESERERERPSVVNDDVSLLTLHVETGVYPSDTHTRAYKYRRQQNKQPRCLRRTGSRYRNIAVRDVTRVSAKKFERLRSRTIDNVTRCPAFKVIVSLSRQTCQKWIIAVFVKNKWLLLHLFLNPYFSPQT